MNWEETLAGTGALAVLLDATLNSFDLIISVVDVVFPIVALLDGYLAPYLGWMSEEVTTKLLLLVSLLYLVHLTLKLKRRIQDARS